MPARRPDRVRRSHFHLDGLGEVLHQGAQVLGGLKRVGRTHKRHVERAGFMVLKSPDIPSILVETAFLSNPEEERKLNSPAYRRKLAAAVLSGIKAYFLESPPPGTTQWRWGCRCRFCPQV